MLQTRGTVTSSQQPAAMPPSFVTCYICGREFGTRSISIHVPKCAAKWEAQQEQLPRVRRARAWSTVITLTLLCAGRAPRRARRPRKL